MHKLATREILAEFWFQNLKKKHYFEDTKVDKRIILKCIIKETG